MENNDKCFCGSGKKHIDCCKNKKPRMPMATFQVSETVQADSILFEQDGTIRIMSNGKEIPVLNTGGAVVYERKKGLKILTTTPPVDQELKMYSEDVWKNFDVILAVDTNTKKIDDKLISATCIAQCIIMGNQAEYKVIGSFVNEDQQQPEKQAWVRVISDLISWENYSPQMKIAVIVDSDLGNIPKINLRELPIFDNFYLPPNFILTYASADTGKEFLANKMIVECDKDAGVILNNIANGIV